MAQQVLTPSDVLDACVDRIIPDELKDEARKAQMTEQGATPELALQRLKKWKPGRELEIYFLDGESQVQAKVAEVAKQWMKFANIKLKFGNNRNAQIRISFKQRGYWSAIGTDALVTDYFPKNQPTMNFQGFNLKTPDSEYHRRDEPDDDQHEPRSRDDQFDGMHAGQYRTPRRAARGGRTLTGEAAVALAVYSSIGCGRGATAKRLRAASPAREVQTKKSGMNSTAMNVAASMPPITPVPIE